MVNKYISNNGFLCIFKKCSICGVDVLCNFKDGVPETHNRGCDKKPKIFKLEETKKEVENAG